MSITDPRDIPGLRAWYSPQAETTYADGATLTTLHDQSGNGHDGTASGAVTWKATAGASGGPCITFAGGKITLPSSVFTGLTAAQVMVEIIAATYSKTTQGHWTMGSQTGGPDRWPYGSSGVDMYFYEDFGSSARYVINDNAGPAVNELWGRWTVWSAPGDWGALYNETGFLGSTSIQNGTAGVAFPSTPVLGQSENGLAFAGSYGGLVIYDHKLTATELSDLATWFGANPSGGVPGSATAQPPSLTSTATVTAPALTAEPPPLASTTSVSASALAAQPPPITSSAAAAPPALVAQAPGLTSTATVSVPNASHVTFAQPPDLTSTATATAPSLTAGPPTVACHAVITAPVLSATPLALSSVALVSRPALVAQPPPILAHATVTTPALVAHLPGATSTATVSVPRAYHGAGAPVLRLPLGAAITTPDRAAAITTPDRAAAITN